MGVGAVLVEGWEGIIRHDKCKIGNCCYQPAFREAWKTRRCLVPSDWFYEWQKQDEKTKQPYAIAMKDDGMFAFAGLWEKWKDKTTGQVLRTYTILTTDPNELTEPIHNRMPVIVPPKEYERWPASTDPAHLPVDLLRP